MQQKESRVKKSLLNARVNLLFYFLTLALTFFSRKIFLDCLGADFLGLTGTLYNLLGFLNLAELGIGSAIGYVLYKPLYDQDRQRINEIISVMGYLYRWIGFVILLLGTGLACFMPWLYPDTGFDLPLIYFAYFTFLFSSLLGYFVNYRQNLLGADQKNYIITAYSRSANILKLIVQIALASYTGDYYLWVAIEIPFSIAYSVALNWKIRRCYPWLSTEWKRGRQLMAQYPEIARYTKQLFVHKIAGFFQYQATPYIIYAFISLKLVAYYGNYVAITEKMIVFVGSFLDSTFAGVGNLIAEGNQAKIESVYWKLVSVRFLAGGIFVYTLYSLIPSFINLWIGAEYLLSDTVLLLLMCNVFLEVMRGTTDQYLYGYGLFYDVWAPLAESAIFVVVAVAGGRLWGLEGILLGSIVSKVLIVYLWKSYFLYSKGFKLSVWRFWPKWLFYFLLSLVALLVSNRVLHQSLSNDMLDGSWQAFLLHGVKTFVGFGFVSYVLLLVFSQGMRTFSLEIIRLGRNWLRHR